MRRVRKFLALPRTERWLLTRAVVTVGSIRVGLWLLPFRTLRPLLARLASPALRPADRWAATTSADRVAWAVSAAARYVPRATCLTQALAAQHLLVRCGEQSEVHIGVAREERSGIAAHAWLTARGRVVIGNQSLERYLPLTHFSQPPPRNERGQG